MEENPCINLEGLFKGADLSGAQIIAVNNGEVCYQKCGNAAKEGSKTEECVLNLLDELVKDAIDKKKTAKYILLPVRAAKDANMLPIADLKWMNERYQLTLNATNWSSWVNNSDAGYDHREISPLVERFQALKNDNM